MLVQSLIDGQESDRNSDKYAICPSTFSNKNFASINSWVVPNLAGTYVVEISLVPAQLTEYDAALLKVNLITQKTWETIKK